MLYTRISIIALLLSISALADAQIRVSHSRVQGSGSGQIYVMVSDSTTQDRLIGASVFMVDGGDTLKFVTDITGRCSIGLNKFKSKSVVVSASYMGFKELSGQFDLPADAFMDMSIDISLPENPMELNSIIVKGDAIAMVMHGDTTVFNATAFKNMQGDVLRDLLKQFPGVEISTDGISYKGRKIDRILFNGHNLFGKDMDNAMDMVLANEVRDVKVYSQTAEDDTEQDGTHDKEYVMNVRTWKPLEHVGRLLAEVLGGLYTSKKDDGAVETLGQARLDIGDYTLKSRPRLSMKLWGGHNANENSPYAQDSPRNDIGADLKISKDIRGKLGYSHNIKFGSVKESSYTDNYKLYQPSDSWTERNDTANIYGRTLTRTLNYVGTGFWRKNGHALRADGGVSLRQAMSLNHISSSSWQDKTWSGYDKNVRDTSKSLDFRISVSWQYKLKPSNSKIDISARFNGHLENGDGRRSDTLSNSISREWLVNSGRTRRFTPGLTASWLKFLGNDNKSKLTVGINPGYNYSHVRNIYYNVLTGSMDQNNSLDYDNRNFSNTTFLAYTYGQANDGMFLRLRAGVRNIVCQRDEKHDFVGNWHKKYLRPDIEVVSSYVKGANQYKLVYGESEDVPSASQLRESINDSNPLFLSTGNASLRLPVNRKLTMSYGCSFAKTSSVLKISAEGVFNSNSISSKTEYFTEDTWLDKYQYTAPAGSALVSPVNVSGRYSVNTRASYEGYLTKCDMNYVLTAGYSSISNPYYITENLYRNVDNMLTSSMLFSRLTEKCSITLTPEASVGRSICDGEKLYDYLSLNITGTYEQRIGKHFGWYVSCRDALYRTTVSGLDYNNISLDCEIFWLLGKDSQSRITVFGANLINSFDGKKVERQTDYVSRTLTSYLGRAIGISFRYNLFKR